MYRDVITCATVTVVKVSTQYSFSFTSRPPPVVVVRTAETRRPIFCNNIALRLFDGFEFFLPRSLSTIMLLSPL